eukprot:TRINITY_DN1297_c1_g2_i3.p1 TRINITY_DN1297_c1_g2~~TRINITY_DN1297_c1_g2_i3.p1  ORF type:complete len:145 (+),score=7.11 TRINITY_DN1297_c1_g2_i3:48-437(+)
MALSSFPSVIVTTPVPKPSYQTRVRVSVSSVKRTLGGFQFNGNRNWTRLNAGGLTEIEPDLIEDKHDRWATNGVPPGHFGKQLLQSMLRLNPLQASKESFPGCFSLQWLLGWLTMFRVSTCTLALPCLW